MIHDLILENNLDILCITETWLQPFESAAISSLLPDTHNFFSNPRETGRGGGVAVIAIRSLLEPTQKNGRYLTFESMEFCFTRNNSKYTIFNVYRPPNSSYGHFFGEFTSFLVDSQSRSGKIIYAGDFNFPVNKVEDTKAREFLEILDTFHLKNHVTMATHQSGNILDLIITNKDFEEMKNIAVESVNSISDHHVIYFNIESEKPKIPEKIIRYRDKHKFCHVRFSRFLMEEVYEKFKIACPHNEIQKCVNCYVKIFNQRVENYMEINAPLVEKKIKITSKNNRWYNDQVKRKKRELRKAERKMHSQKTEQSKNEYRRLRQQKIDLIAKEKKIYYLDEIEKCGNNSSKLYKTLNFLLGRDLGGLVKPFCQNDENLANDFKSYFSEKIERINCEFENVLPTNEVCIPDFPTVKFEKFSPVDELYIEKLLKSAKKTYCTLDSFNPRIMEGDNIVKLVPMITDIVNLSLQSGKFPDNFKTAIVKPQMKGKNDKEKLSSYRPVNNLTFISKIIEAACLHQLENHIESFEALPKFQSAYRKVHSVETSACRLYNDMIGIKANGKNSLLIQLDLSAAFDTVDIKILLQDLKDLGIDGVVHEWFESYLSHRKFVVEIGSSHSSQADVSTGIMQGSILAPILFNIYTSGLPLVLHNHNVTSMFYADDTQILVEFDESVDINEKLSEVFNSIKNWMKNRKLKLNVSKTEAFLAKNNSIRSNPSFTDITVDDNQINLENPIRSLGIMFDTNLTLRNQIQSAKKKAIFNLLNIVRIAKFINKDSRIKLMHNLVFSHLDFGNSLYYNLPNRDLHGIQIIINNASRVIVGMPRYSRDRITPVNISLHFLPVRARIMYKICLLTHKALVLQKPAYLAELLVPHESLQSLRNSSNRQLQEPIIGNSSYSNRCFRYCAPRLYNKLSSELRVLESIDAFKKHLKTEIFRMAYDMETLTVRQEFAV